jgi:hypothetical protein
MRKRFKNHFLFIRAKNVLPHLPRGGHGWRLLGFRNQILCISDVNYFIYIF